MGVIRNNLRRNSSENSESINNLSINDLLEVANQLDDQPLEIQEPLDEQDSNEEDQVILIVPATGRRVGNRNAINRLRSDGRMAEMIAEVEAKRAERRSKKSSTCKYNPPRPEPTFRGLGTRGRSNRKHRRFENGNMVAQSLAIAGVELDLTSSFDTLSIDDFVPQTMSAFARLLMEKEHMKAWNDFIQCSEEEQEDFLRLIDSKRENEWVNGGHNINGKNAAAGANSPNNRTSKAQSRQTGRPGKKANETTPSKGRGDHPAFSPELSFARIDANLKKFLRGKHIPLSLLETMEEEVSVFFETQPVNSIYRSCLPSGFQRLLLHATAQYLNLVCKSFDSDGDRLSHVFNKRGAFVRPTIKLSEYLESPRSDRYPRRRFGRKNGAIPNNFAVHHQLG